MKKKSTINQSILFTLFIISLLITNNVVKTYLINNGIEDYNIHITYRTVSNIILALVSFLVAKKLHLFELGGLSNIKPKKLRLLIFPLIYLLLLYVLLLDSIPNFNTLDLILLTIYCISIGISEELSLRSVLLPLISKYFGNDRKAHIKAVFISALLFGLLHLINFDKGIYGEISQVFFATFMGVMFGALLLVIKRVYPLIIIHAFIDFIAKLDTINTPVKQIVLDPMDIESAILSALLIAPCLIYGIYVIRKQLPLES